MEDSLIYEVEIQIVKNVRFVLKNFIRWLFGYAIHCWTVRCSRKLEKTLKPLILVVQGHSKLSMLTLF